MAADSRLRITVCYAAMTTEAWEMTLQLEPGSTVLQALQHGSVLARCSELDVQQLDLGIWGRKCSSEQLLRDRDRVEIYRPLLVDPKMARRERFVKQGARRAGLFAKTRPGAKPGY